MVVLSNVAPPPAHNAVSEISIPRENQRARQFCDNVQKLGENTGLTVDELMKIATFIEEQLPNYTHYKYCYLKKEVTNLPRTIEYDPRTRMTFIHLKKKGGVKILGKGGFKTVTQSILYDRKRPEIVANCTTSVDEEHEVATFKKLHGQKGIAKVYACTKHIKYTGERRLAILMKRYQPGSLGDIIDKKTHQFTTKEKMKIVHQVLQGLESLHNHKIVHRDLKPGNILIDIQVDPKTGRRRVEAAITDFGMIYDKNVRKDTLSVAHGTPIFIPPVGLFPKSVHRNQFKHLDIYPLGCTFYELFYERSPEWLESKDVEKFEKEVQKLLHEGTTQKQIEQIYRNHINTVVQPRIHTLHALKKKKKISQKQEFELLVLRMIKPSVYSNVHENPKELRKKLEHIMK